MRHLHLEVRVRVAQRKPWLGQHLYLRVSLHVAKTRTKMRMRMRPPILALKHQSLAWTHGMEQGLEWRKYLARKLSVVSRFFLESRRVMTKRSEGLRCDAIMAKRMRNA